MVSSRVGDSVDNQDKCWPQPVFSEGVIIINYYCRFAILLPLWYIVGMFHWLRISTKRGFTCCGIQTINRTSWSTILLPQILQSPVVESPNKLSLD